jgi:hypothetical protein
MLGLGLRIEGKNICAMKPHNTSVMVKVFGRKRWNYTILKLKLKIKIKKEEEHIHVMKPRKIECHN